MKAEEYTEDRRGCPVKGNAYPVLVLCVGNPLMGDDGVSGITARWCMWRREAPWA